MQIRSWWGRSSASKYCKWCILLCYGFGNAWGCTLLCIQLGMDPTSWWVLDEHEANVILKCSALPWMHACMHSRQSLKTHCCANIHIARFTTLACHSTTNKQGMAVATIIHKAMVAIYVHNKTRVKHSKLYIQICLLNIRCTSRCLTCYAMTAAQRQPHKNSHWDK